MFVPESIVTEAADLLNQDIENSLQTLGEELYRIEAQQSVGTLSVEAPKRDLLQRAEDFLVKKKDVLRKAICEDWNDKAREDFLDTSKLLAQFIALIAEVLDYSITYITIPMNVAVILIKRGINNFCKE